MSVSLKTIANKLGVSVTTVSRVVNNKAKEYRIGKETEKKVLELVRELNFAPNQIARGLKLQHTNTIGLVIPDISNPFFAGIARSIEKEARKHGCAILLSDSEEDTNIEIEQLKILGSRKVDGLIIAPVGEQFTHLLDLKKQNVHFVLVDRYFQSQPFTSVASDNFYGAQTAVEYLIQNGHKRIGYIQGTPNTITNSERLKAYKSVLQKHDLIYTRTLIIGQGFSFENGYTSATKMLELKNRPTAIFASSNLNSLGAITAIRDKNIKIPEDISIIGFDEQPYSDLLATPLTTIKQNKEFIGKKAFMLLYDKIRSKNKTPDENILIPTELIERKSVKNLRLSSNDNHHTA